MKNKAIVGIFALYIMAIGFSWLSTEMFNSRMDDDTSKIEERMSKDGVAQSTIEAVSQVMNQTQRNVDHYVPSVAFLLINVIVTMAIIMISRVSALEKAIGKDRVGVT